MSSERRVLRPYRGLHALEQLIDQVRLDWGASRLEPGRRTVRLREFMEEPVDVRFPDGFSAALTEALAPTGVPVDSAELVVVATSTRLKLADVIDRFSLTAVPPDLRLTESLDRRPVFTTAFSGVSVNVAVVLSEALAPEPLRPSRQGTWLARTSFVVVTDLGDVGFTPQPLTDKDREDFRLPAGTAHFFQCDGVLQPAQADDALVVFVDEELLSVLDDQARGPVGLLLQQELFVDAMRSVIAAVGQEWDDSTTETAVDGSLAQRLAQKVAGEDTPGQATWGVLQQMRQNPSVAGARVEAIVPGYAKARINAVRK